MMEIVGFAWIKNPAPTHSGLGKPEDFAGKIVPCLEINQWGDVLVFHAEKMATFDKTDVLKSFRCSVFNTYVLPPSDPIQRMEHHQQAARMSSDVKAFNAAVIAVSIQKGEYYMDIFKK